LVKKRARCLTAAFLDVALHKVAALPWRFLCLQFHDKRIYLYISYGYDLFVQHSKAGTGLAK
jgi:hypothetical protein